MRKIFIFVSLLIHLISSACSGNSPNYSSINSYTMANESLDKHQDEKVDEDFLKAIENSILWRIRQPNSSKLDILANTELAYIKDFIHQPFYDKKLKNLAQKYIKGLNLQLESLSEKLPSDGDIKRLRGTVYCYEVLNKLYSSYNFLSENAEFVGIYISGFEAQKKLYNAYKEIDNDIALQAKNMENRCTYFSDHLTFKFTNNTKYTYDTTFEFSIMDKNNTIIDHQITSIETITPHRSFEVSVYKNQNHADNFDWNNYYSNIHW